MCLPWNHKWRLIDYTLLPMYGITIAKRCTHCGKEIVRKYRV